MLVPQSLPTHPKRVYPSEVINSAQSWAIVVTPHPDWLGWLLNP